MDVLRDRDKLFFLCPLSEAFKQVSNRCCTPGTHCTLHILVKTCSLWRKYFLSKSYRKTPVLGHHLERNLFSDEWDFILLWTELFLKIVEEEADK
jgi:hypothetical protein